MSTTGANQMMQAQVQHQPPSPPPRKSADVPWPPPYPPQHQRQHQQHQGGVGTSPAGVDPNTLSSTTSKSLSLISVNKQKGSGGQNREVIKLTNDGFKLFCMLAPTERGHQVRMYYLDLEKKVHALKRSFVVFSDTFRQQLVENMSATTLPDDLKRQMEPSFQGFLHTAEPYPVDFDQVWLWLGYSKKANAKRRLELPELKNEIVMLKAEQQTGSGGHNREKIMMSVDGFKLMAMLTQTDRGPQVRMYYLDLEKKVHALKRSIDAGEVELVPGDAARKRARIEAKEDRDEELAIMQHQQTIVQHRHNLLNIYRTSLGTLDGRDEIILKDFSMRMLNPGTMFERVTGSSTLAITGGEAPLKEISIQIVALKLGLKLGNHSSKVGKAMARRYRAKYSKEPPKRTVIFHGRPIPENAYFETDTDLMEAAVKEVLCKA